MKRIRITCHCRAYPFPHRLSGGACSHPKHLAIVGQYRSAIDHDDDDRAYQQVCWDADRAASIRSIGGIVR